jgi:hypothetical protein
MIRVANPRRFGAFRWLGVRAEKTVVTISMISYEFLLSFRKIVLATHTTNGGASRAKLRYSRPIDGGSVLGSTGVDLSDPRAHE